MGADLYNDQTGLGANIHVMYAAASGTTAKVNAKGGCFTTSFVKCAQRSDVTISNLLSHITADIKADTSKSHQLPQSGPSTTDDPILLKWRFPDGPHDDTQ